MKGKCFKCGDKAAHEWRICSDGPWRKVCTLCDLQLNMLALQWAWPNAWKRKYEAYRNKVLGR